jgi:hypothetical protein
MESRETLRRKLNQGSMSFFGNKMPNYYFRLATLRRQLPQIKLFYIYRSPTQFVYSWDRRAADENDVWPQGRRGIFGVTEQIFCLKRIAQFSDVTMVPYEVLYYRDRALMRDVTANLGADPRLFDQPAFEALLSPAPPPRDPDPDYASVFEQFRFDLIDGFFANTRIANSGNQEFRDAVKRQFVNVPSPDEFARLVGLFGAPLPAIMSNGGGGIAAGCLTIVTTRFALG